jgi:hypothetical protein
MVDARIPYAFKVFFKFFLYAISKVALMKYVWLIFKLDYLLDDDLHWIKAS